MPDGRRATAAESEDNEGRLDAAAEYGGRREGLPEVNIGKGIIRKLSDIIQRRYLLSGHPLLRSSRCRQLRRCRHRRPPSTLPSSATRPQGPSGDRSTSSPGALQTERLHLVSKHFLFTLRCWSYQSALRLSVLWMVLKQKITPTQ